MSPTATGTLARWGNSQGVRIPRDICDLLGLKIGAKADIKVDQAKSEVTLIFDQPHSQYRRNRKVSMEELCSGWSGEKIGEEWGGMDVGAEVVQ